MVRMKKNVNIQDMLTIMLWLKTFYVIEGKTFKYEDLLEQAETYNYTNTPWNTDIHNIDDIVIESFKIYQRLKSTKDKVESVLNSLNSEFIDKTTFMTERENYERIFENLMMNYKYEDPEARGIQKGFLSEKMQECVQVEDYEQAAIIRDTIEECNRGYFY